MKMATNNVLTLSLALSLFVNCAWAKEKMIVNALSCDHDDNIYRLAHGPNVSYPHRSAVTNAAEGGRLGDRLLLYCKAKWIAYKYKLPYYYRPFPNSDAFVLHGKEIEISTIINDFEQTKYIRDEKEIDLQKKSVLYNVSYWCKTDDCFDVMMADKNFIKILREMLAPLIRINPFHLPHGIITVAVHVRKGSYHDRPLHSQQVYNRPRPSSDVRWPTKFPPDQYYIDQIKKLSDMVGSRPLYVYIFSDHPKPALIAENYKKIINLDSITFNSRNAHAQIVTFLDDFYALTHFDVLIRPDSNFAGMAEMIGDHKLVFYPKHAQWQGNKLIIDQVGLRMYDPTFFGFSV